MTSSDLGERFEGRRKNRVVIQPVLQLPKNWVL